MVLDDVVAKDWEKWIKNSSFRGCRIPGYLSLSLSVSLNIWLVIYPDPKIMDRT